MNNNYIEYYLNQEKPNKGCSIPKPINTNNITNSNNYLVKKENLRDIENKKQALNNLGILELIAQLKAIIDSKVVAIGGIPYDIEPTLGNTENILSSDSIYRALQQKQDKLKSGINIKTINEQPLIGSGNIIIREKGKGYFSNEEELLQQYPDPLKGDWAIVGNYKYICNQYGQWTNSGIVCKDEEIQEAVNSLEQGIDSLEGEVTTIGEKVITLEDLLEVLQNKVNQLKPYTPGEDTPIIDESILERLDNLEDILNEIQSNPPIKHIILTESEYNALTEYEKDAMYLIVEKDNSVFHFGDTFPIILG